MFSRTWRSLVLVVGETLLLVAAVVISSALIAGSYAWEMLSDNTAMLRVFLIVLVCQVCLHYSDLYDLRTITTKGDFFRRLLRALGATSLILGIAYWFQQCDVPGQSSARCQQLAHWHSVALRVREAMAGTSELAANGGRAE